MQIIEAGTSQIRSSIATHSTPTFDRALRILFLSLLFSVIDTNLFPLQFGDFDYNESV
jgi:hypothetical protein